MSKLLRSGFIRLLKSKVFWLEVAFSCGFGILITLTRYRGMLKYPDHHVYMDHFLYADCMFMPVAAAVLIGLLIGAEYGDGTIRNKLIVGHTRRAMYLSNLLVCTAALFWIHLAYMAVVVGLGLPLIGAVAAPAAQLVVYVLVSLVTVAALSAIFLLVSMLIPSKANGAVAAILLALAILMGGAYINAQLNEPEYYNSYVMSYTDDAGNEREVVTEREKNPRYLAGTKREIFEFLHDFLPGGQMMQITEQNAAHLERLPLYSLVILIGTTACGICFFRRKNIK